MIEIQNPERTEARKQFLHNVFVTALEGGIGYWSAAEEYHWGTDGGAKVVDDLDDFYSVIVSSEEDWGVEEAYIAEEGKTQPITETQCLRVDINVIERGSNMLVEKVLSGEFKNERLMQFVVAWSTNGDDGDYDADGADLVVQLGLFGEVVYG